MLSNGGIATADGGGSAAAPARPIAISSALAPALGKLVSAMMASPAHRAMALGDVVLGLLPAIEARQFAVAEATPPGAAIAAPVGLLVWASVSASVDQRLLGDATSPVPLAAHEWRSGEVLWLIEAIGGPSVMEAMLGRLLEGPFAGRPFRLRTRRPDGTYAVETIDPSSG